jgi:PAS domain S-box-containing protein
MGVWEWDMRTHRLHYSDACSTMLGYAPGEIESSLSAWGKLVHPGDLARVRRALDAHLDGRSDLYHVELRLRARDGSWRWIVDRGRVVERDDNGDALRAVGVHIDANVLRRSSVAANHSPWKSGAHPCAARKLLVVDDDPALLAIMETIASRAGYEVVGATSFEDALTVLESNPDVCGVVTDYELGSHSGAELSDAVRGRAPDLPVLLVSGTDPKPTDLDRVDGFLAKPFDVDGFIDALDELLPPPSEDAAAAPSG